jgi:hypothetical protein
MPSSPSPTTCWPTPTMASSSTARRGSPRPSPPTRASGLSSSSPPTWAIGRSSWRESAPTTRHTASTWPGGPLQQGARGLLVVTPYYNKPTQPGLVAHFNAIADATDLPVLVYDIPGRTGIPIQTDTLLRLAEHPRIVAVKDAKGDLWAASQVMAATDLQWYSGDDVLNLAHLAQGAVGVVSVVGHVAGDEYAAMIRAVAAGDLATARAIHHRLIPVVRRPHVAPARGPSWPRLRSSSSVSSPVRSSGSRSWSRHPSISPNCARAFLSQESVESSPSRVDPPTTARRRGRCALSLSVGLGRSVAT